MFHHHSPVLFLLLQQISQFYQQHELFSIIHNEMLLCLSWPLDLVSHLDAARLREHFSNERLLIEVFLCWENHCFSDDLVLFFFLQWWCEHFRFGSNKFSSSKTRLMLSPSFLAITDRSLTPSLSSNIWCFPLCNALVIALQTLQYISYFRVNELPENFQVDMKFWCGVRPCCTSVKFWSF